MINLAGDQEADLHIREELLLAQIPIYKTEGEVRSEVPYSLTGKESSWSFERGWYYWIATAEPGNGLEITLAEGMHNTTYPLREAQQTTYGEVIRSGGHCGALAPRDYGVQHITTDGKAIILDPEGKQEASFERMDLDTSGFMFVKELSEVEHRSEVNLYHIDSQLGLNKFVETIRKKTGL